MNGIFVCWHPCLLTCSHLGQLRILVLQAFHSASTEQVDLALLPFAERNDQTKKNQNKRVGKSVQLTHTWCIRGIYYMIQTHLMAYVWFVSVLIASHIFIAWHCMILKSRDRTVSLICPGQLPSRFLLCGRPLLRFIGGSGRDENRPYCRLSSCYLCCWCRAVDLQIRSNSSKLDFPRCKMHQHSGDSFITCNATGVYRVAPLLRCKSYNRYQSSVALLKSTKCS